MLANPPCTRFPTLAPVCLAAVLLLGPSIAHAQAAHPHVLFGADQVAAFRSQAQSTQKALASSITAGAATYRGSTVTTGGSVTLSGGGTVNLGDLRDIGNSLVTFAFAWELDGADASYQLAHDWLVTLAGWGNLDLDGTHDLVQAQLLIGVSLAYDMLAPRLTSAERQSVLAAITANADALKAAGDSGTWWSAEYMQNHNWINHAAVGFAALATQGEVDATKNAAWLASAVTNAQRVDAALDGITDGTWHEGFAYAAYGMNFYLPFVDALVRAGGPDLRDIGMMRSLGRTRAYVQLPEQPSAYVLTAGDFFGFSTDEALHPLRYAAARYRDGVAQAVADRWAAGTRRSTYAPELSQAVFEFLAYDPSVPATDLHTLPLDWYGKDLQVAVFRSGWDAGATLFALKDGPYTGTASWNRYRTGGPPQDLNWGHDHADDNGFFLYGKGAWLAPEAAGYYIGHDPMPGQEANRTVFHNSLLIDGAGQLGEGVHSAGDEAAGYPWFTSRTGSLAGFGSTDHFGYVRGDGAHLYPASVGLTQWDRHALFVDRQWVILRDVIRASSSHTFGWLCHFLSGATREGNWLHGVASNGQSLGVALVAPSNVNVSIGTQSPVDIQDVSPSGSVYEATVSPAASAPATTFLTALVPTTETAWASRPTVSALDAANPGAGLTAVGNGVTTVALFSDQPGGSAQAASYALHGTTGLAEYRSGVPTRAVLVEGTQLTDPTRALMILGSADTLEADGMDGATLTLSGSGAAGRIYAPKATQVIRQGQAVAFTRDGDDVQVGPFAYVTPPSGGGGSPSSGSPSDPLSSKPAASGCSVVRGGRAWTLVPLLLAALLIRATRRRLRRRQP